MVLSKKISTRNLYSFLWHASFLAFAQSFIDVDTILPAMIVESGGGAIQIGILTAIMMGGSSFTQLFFAPFISNIPYKKKYLLFGINMRVLSLIGLAVILYYFIGQADFNIIWVVFFFISIFSLSGAFTNISYVDILGKSIDQSLRKTFFSAKQIIAAIVILSSAVLAKHLLASLEYPLNYASMFVVGGVALLIASIGFWNIKEVEPSRFKISGVKDFLQKMLEEIRQNKRLAYFLGFINTQGIVISFIPFMMLFAKENFNTQAVDTGEFLLFKMLGAVLGSSFVLLSNRRIKYVVLMYANVVLSISLVLLAVFVIDAETIKYIFILGGISFSIYLITMNGVLLEVSGTKNRALYVGLAGAGNIIPAIFPLISGGLIEQLGFSAFFGLFVIIVSFAAFFISRIKCDK